MNTDYSKTIVKCFFVFTAVYFLLWPGFSVFATEKSSDKAIPRIDDEAAYIKKGDRPVHNATPARNDVVTSGEHSVADGELKVEKENIGDELYSQNFWMLLFGAYLFLLIFNLSFEFGKKRKLQWLWEAVFTFLAIYVWDNLDVGRSNSWFPGVVLESGIIIYAFYFYFLDKKLKTE